METEAGSFWGLTRHGGGGSQSGPLHSWLPLALEVPDDGSFEFWTPLYLDLLLLLRLLFTSPKEIP